MKPRIFHFLGATRIMRYIRGTTYHETFVLYQQNTGIEAKVYGYFNSNWSCDQNGKKSTLDYLFMIEASPILWS